VRAEHDRLSNPEAKKEKQTAQKGEERSTFWNLISANNLRGRLRPEKDVDGLVGLGGRKKEAS